MNRDLQTNLFCLRHYLPPTFKSTANFSSSSLFVLNIGEPLLLLIKNKSIKQQKGSGLSVQNGGKKHLMLSFQTNRKLVVTIITCGWARGKKTEKTDCWCRWVLFGVVDIFAITLWLNGHICSPLFAALLNRRDAINHCLHSRLIWQLLFGSIFYSIKCQTTVKKMSITISWRWHLQMSCFVKPTVPKSGEWDIQLTITQDQRCRIRWHQ